MNTKNLFKMLPVFMSKLSQKGTSEVAAAHQSGGKFSMKSAVNGAFVLCREATTKTSAEGLLMIPFFVDLLVFFLTR